MNALFSLCIHTVMIFITVSFAAEKSDKKEHTETTQSPAFHGFSNKDTASEKDPRNPVPGHVSGRVYRNTVVKNASETNNDDVKGGSWTVYPEDDSPYVSYNATATEVGNYQPLWLQPDHVHHGVSDTPAKSKKGRPVKVLYIGGFFELSGDPRMAAMGLSEKVAALMAIDHINEQDILPGYELRMFYGDTKCDPGTGADAFYDMVYTEQLMMLFGSSCSDVTSMIGQIVEYWNLLFVSHASSAPALSDRETFPTFYRLAAADVSHNAAQKKFIQHFNWNTVAIIHEDHEQYNLAVHTLQSTIEAANIKVALTTSFRIQDSNLPDKMRQIKDNDIRIIIGSFSEDIAYHVFCEAYRQQIYGLKYVWLLVGDFTSQWWEKSHNFSDCTEQELTEAVNGYFAVNSLNFIVGNSKSTSGLTNEKFEAQYDQKAKELNARVTRSAHAPQMYDTVWTIALTLQAAANASGGLENFRYENGTVWKSLFFDIMGKLTFQGVSGPVSFTDTGDRRGISAFTRCQNGVMTSVALYYPNNDTLSLNCKECKPLLWTDGRPPADKYSVVIQRSLIDPVAFYTISALCGAGIFLALVFLFFNLLNLRRRYIKLSSPKLNNVAVIGCILVYSAVLLLGFDDGTLSSKLYPTVCTVRAFLFAAGFSLAFGAMFTKTYRVHQICIGAGTGLVKNKLLKDKHLFFIIGALLVFDSAIVSLWALADPMVRNEKNITTEPAPEDPHRILYVRQHLHCHSQQQNIWLGVFYTYKGLLMIFGTFLAWSTRKVKIEALNDSRYIGLSVYNVVVMSILVVALTAVIPDQPTLAYCIASSIIIVSTTVTLCLLFVPKIHALVKSSGNPVITTSGLTVEAETRRLTCDDSKEKLFRAEVQNKTFKSELAEVGALWIQFSD
ncbi:gamma-aminobutyric acid type B receptor subunit 2 [Lingula anatina]|uniref:Gamma-aminobutyric acid type B receptor subunit 2 n=1 Tax=Lingula anatina TaxID=7574 RepID=A0A1S3H821_LINAN|nr:gamma-aminobutyric acid type B receptor subunit 2 [Lingula anatina]|eukprot:XP_013382265.1 gamma-aminobutyric acid type B receptor subunit 2 [Lingula anatina]